MDVGKFIAALVVLLIESDATKLETIVLRRGDKRIAIPVNQPIHVTRIRGVNLANLKIPIMELAKLISHASVRSFAEKPQLPPTHQPLQTDRKYQEQYEPTQFVQNNYNYLTQDSSINQYPVKVPKQQYYPLPYHPYVHPEEYSQSPLDDSQSNVPELYPSDINIPDNTENEHISHDSFNSLENSNHHPNAGDILHDLDSYDPIVEGYGQHNEQPAEEEILLFTGDSFTSYEEKDTSPSTWTEPAENVISNTTPTLIEDELTHYSSPTSQEVKVTRTLSNDTRTTESNFASAEDGIILHSLIEVDESTTDTYDKLTESYLHKDVVTNPTSTENELMSSPQDEETSIYTSSDTTNNISSEPERTSDVNFEPTHSISTTAEYETTTYIPQLADDGITFYIISAQEDDDSNSQISQTDENVKQNDSQIIVEDEEVTVPYATTDTIHTSSPVQDITTSVSMGSYPTSSLITDALEAKSKITTIISQTSVAPISPMTTDSSLQTTQTEAEEDHTKVELYKQNSSTHAPQLSTKKYDISNNTDQLLPSDSSTLSPLSITTAEKKASTQNTTIQSNLITTTESDDTTDIEIKITEPIQDDLITSTRVKDKNTTPTITVPTDKEYPTTSVPVTQPSSKTTHPSRFTSSTTSCTVDESCVQDKSSGQTTAAAPILSTVPLQDTLQSSVTNSPVASLRHKRTTTLKGAVTSTSKPRRHRPCKRNHSKQRGKKGAAGHKRRRRRRRTTTPATLRITKLNTIEAMNVTTPLPAHSKLILVLGYTNPVPAHTTPASEHNKPAPAMHTTAAPPYTIPVPAQP